MARIGVPIDRRGYCLRDSWGRVPARTERRNRDNEKGEDRGGLAGEEAAKPTEEQHLAFGTAFRRFSPLDEDLVYAA